MLATRNSSKEEVSYSNNRQPSADEEVIALLSDNNNSQAGNNNNNHARSRTRFLLCCPMFFTQTVSSPCLNVLASILTVIAVMALVVVVFGGPLVILIAESAGILVLFGLMKLVRWIAKRFFHVSKRHGSPLYWLTLTGSLMILEFVCSISLIYDIVFLYWFQSGLAHALYELWTHTEFRFAGYALYAIAISAILAILPTPLYAVFLSIKDQAQEPFDRQLIMTHSSLFASWQRILFKIYKHSSFVSVLMFIVSFVLWRVAEYVFLLFALVENFRAFISITKHKDDREKMQHVFEQSTLKMRFGRFAILTEQLLLGIPLAAYGLILLYKTDYLGPNATLAVMIKLGFSISNLCMCTIYTSLENDLKALSLGLPLLMAYMLLA